MAASLRVGHYQCECAPGEYGKNVAKVLDGLEFAESERLDVMTFPESFLTGYFSTMEKFRRLSWAADGPEMRGFLEKARQFSAMFVVGFNERRDGKIYNSAAVVERGEILGIYSKAFPCSEHETPGRSFPVFEKNGVKFGVVICADGGYIEPTRILALKGARVVFAPHYNYIGADNLLGHFVRVRNDHAARAVENGVWFMRCNNVCLGRGEGLDHNGVGYGDSYLMDPNGEIVARSQRHKECFMAATVALDDARDPFRRTRASALELLPHLQGALGMATKL